MDGLRNNLALNVKSRRGALTQEAFAQRIGLDQASVHGIEQGLQNFTIDTLQVICDRLKCSAGDLLDRTDRS